MQVPEFPTEESERIRALLACELLDTEPEERFDRVTRIAKHAFNVEIALVSLVDTARQWFKSKQGLDASETPRDISFCGHAILQNDIFLIENATQDQRFADNPLVTGGPCIRFYAGAPLSDKNGYLLGTLCIIDSKPRKFSKENSQALRDLADMIEQEINLASLKRQGEVLAQVQREKDIAANLLSQVVDASSVFAIISTDTVGVIRTFNTGAEKLLGYQREELVDKETPAIFHVRTEMEQRAIQLSKKLGRQVGGFQVFTELALIEGAETNEWTYVRKDGTQVDCRLTVTPVRNDGAEVVGFLGVVEDISREKAQQYKLDRARKEMQKFFDLSLNFMCIANVNGFFEKVNNTFITALGYSEKEMLSTPFFDFIHPDDLEATMREVARLENGAKTLSFRNRYRRKNGGFIHLQWNAAPDEQTGKLYATAIDVTIQYLQQVAIKDHALHMEAVIQNMVDGLIILDANWNIISTNKAFQTLFGYLDEEVKLQKITQLVKDNDYLNQLVDGKPFESVESVFELTAFKKDSQELIIEAGLSKIGDVNDRQYIMLVKDISERKRLERMQNEFVSVVSHELRTPLTSIAGSLGLIAGGALGEVDAKIESMVGIAYSNAKRLSVLINDLLDVEKLVAGGLNIEVKWTQLNPILELSKESNCHYGEGKNVDILLDLDNDVEVCVDQHRLLQVMSNLISNAVKFSAENSQVVISSHLDVDHVEVSVKDFGIGIPSHYLDKIFDKFTQVDATDTRGQSGTGLGLAITKGLIEKMHGEIRVESAIGKGSVFTFRLPTAQTQFAQVSSKPERLIETNQDFVSASLVAEFERNHRALVVEDDQSAAEMIELILKQDGFVVSIATTGEEAIRLLRSEDFAAITLDLDLPDVPGEQVLEFMRSKGTVGQVFLLSNAPTEEIIEVKQSFPSISWSRKPINIIQFKGFVEQVKLNPLNRPKILVLSASRSSENSLEIKQFDPLYIEECFAASTAIRLLKTTTFQYIAIVADDYEPLKIEQLLVKTAVWRGKAKVLLVSELKNMALFESVGDAVYDSLEELLSVVQKEVLDNIEKVGGH